MCLNLAQFSEGKRKQLPSPVFGASPLPLSPLMQKRMAVPLTPTVCPLLPVALQLPTMISAETTLGLPVLLENYFTMTQRLKSS